MDDRLNELDRRWRQTGAVDDRARILREQVRCGQLRQTERELLAYLLDDAARLALDAPEPAWISSLASLRQRMATIPEPRFARLIDLVVTDSPDDRRRLGPRLDRLACAGVDAARRLLLSWFPALTAVVGISEPACRLRAFLLEHAWSSSCVLLLGESGVGHRVAATAIHALSGREQYEELQGSVMTEELFAQQLAETSDRLTRDATLYLPYVCGGGPWEDPILDICDETGCRLIVGDGDPRTPYSARLEARLSATLTIPPLRERLDDLPPLTVAFLSERAVDAHLTEEHFDAMRRYTWPGNVRELLNVLEAIVGWASEGGTDAGTVLLEWLDRRPATD